MVDGMSGLEHGWYWTRKALGNNWRMTFHDGETWTFFVVEHGVVTMSSDEERPGFVNGPMRDPSEARLPIMVWAPL